jgi:hypothetical protein
MPGTDHSASQPSGHLKEYVQKDGVIVTAKPFAAFGKVDKQVILAFR